MSKGLLAVSFGTAYAETRKKTIEAIEADLSAAFPERKLYTAWTSGMILRKLKRLGEETRDTLEEALARMEREGVTDLLVQPTFLQAGYEMRLVKETLEKWKNRFSRKTRSWLSWATAARRPGTIPTAALRRRSAGTGGQISRWAPWNSIRASSRCWSW